MNKCFAVLAAVSLGLCSLLFTGCQTTNPVGDNDYFGVHDSNKRFVPKELHEDE